MKLGIIGLPQSGKTTLFNAASGQEEPVGDFSRAVHRAVIKVPDERLDNLAPIFQPKKITHAEIEFLDAGGFSEGKKKAKGKHDIIHDLRLTDALVIVVDDFNPDSKPEQDLQSVLAELVFADLTLIENNIDKLEREIKLTGKLERAGEVEALKKCLEALNDDKLLFEIGLSKDELKAISVYSFLSLKPQLLTFNISEDKLLRHAEIYNSYKKYCQTSVRDISVICGKIEMELASLFEEDRGEFLKELNIEKPVIEKFIQRSYGLLGLISFFTGGKPECRAWTIKKGTTARKAAGVIHTDFERGFIRAEVASYEDYLQYKKLSELKAAAKLHVEGKDYIVRDGDVILFLFNV
jgi:GTP-binding protein YchF